MGATSDIAVGRASDTVGRGGQPSQRSSRVGYAIVILLLIGLSVVVLWWARWRTYHFAAVQEGVLYRDGNRGMAEFAHAVARGKIRTVVPLVDDAEVADPRKPEFAQELAWCEQHGVKVVRVPVQLGGWPTSEDVKKFLSVVSDRENQPVLVHCAQGVRRTGMMVAAFQQSVLGWDDARCKAAMKTFGHSQRTVGDVERFIDVYDPKTGAVPEGLPVGKE
jgi:protein tyrosine phosphatase (PTP) superfamily phosphohydrolase (DUF442 family)